MVFIRRNARNTHIPDQQQSQKKKVKNAKKGTRTISEAKPNGKEVPVGGKQQEMNTVRNRKVEPASQQLSNAKNRLKGCRTIKTAMQIYHQHYQELKGTERSQFTSDWQDKIREVAFPHFFELLQIKKATSQGLQIAASKGDLEDFHQAFTQLIDKGVIHPTGKGLASPLSAERTKESLQAVQLSMQGNIAADNVVGTENFKMAPAFSMASLLESKENGCPFFIIPEFRDLLKQLADEMGDKQTLNLGSPEQLLARCKKAARDTSQLETQDNAPREADQSVASRASAQKEQEAAIPTPANSTDICQKLDIPDELMDINATMHVGNLVEHLKQSLSDEEQRNTLNYYIAAAETLMGTQELPAYLVNTVRINVYPRVSLRLSENQFHQGTPSKELAKVVAAEVSEEVESATSRAFLFKDYINRELQPDPQKIDKLEERFRNQDKKIIDDIINRVANELT